MSITTKRTAPVRVLAVSAVLAVLAAVALVACDADSACAATGTGVRVPRPAPAPRVPTYSKPYKPSTPKRTGGSTTVVPVPVYVESGC